MNNLNYSDQRDVEERIDTLILPPSRRVNPRYADPINVRKGTNINAGKLSPVVRAELSIIQKRLKHFDQVSEDNLAFFYRSIILAALKSASPLTEYAVEQREYSASSKFFREPKGHISYSLSFYEDIDHNQDDDMYKLISGRSDKHLGTLLGAAIRLLKPKNEARSLNNQQSHLVYLSISPAIRGNVNPTVERDYINYEILGLCEPAVGSLDDILAEFVSFSKVTVADRPLYELH
jgi:hypothetical protein